MSYLLSRFSYLASSIIIPYCIYSNKKVYSRSKNVKIPQEKFEKKYFINNDKTDLRVKVFRTGWLDFLSHDHVIVSKDSSGDIYFTETSDSLKLLRVKANVETLIVDNQEYRNQEGLTTTISESDIKETRKNMLGPYCLDAERFPSVECEVVEFIGTPPDVTMKCLVNLHGVTRLMDVQAKITKTEKKIIIEGQKEFLQSDFGIKPFSAAMGLIQIEDRLLCKFHIEAERKN